MARSKIEVIKELASLDLSSKPYDSTYRLIRELGIYGTMLVMIPKGRVIVRTRPNRNGEVFSKTSDLSYVPSHKNVAFRRASTPKNTMFYGSFFPDQLYEGSIDTARLIGTLEVCSLLRDKTIYQGDETLTYGRWRITEDIPVCAIIHNKQFLVKNPLINKFNSDYNLYVSNHKEQPLNEWNAVLEFLSDQFAKEVVADHDYLISAIYSEMISNTIVGGVRLAGVLYPSVRTEGEGVNVAIAPWFADNCLKLEVVVECTIYKKGNNVVVGNNKVAVLENDEYEFSLEQIKDPKEYISRENAIQYLNS